MIPDSAAAATCTVRPRSRWRSSAAQMPTASAEAAVVTSAPGRASRSIADEAVVAALRSRPNAPTVLSSTSGNRPGRGCSEAASIAMLASAGTAIAAAVQAAESVALATAATTQAAATISAAQPSQLQARSPNRRCSRSIAAPSPVNATAGYKVGSVTHRSGSSPSMGAAMRSTAASPAATTASASAVPSRRLRSRMASAPTPAVAPSINATCPNAPRRSQTTAAKTAPAMTRSRAPMPRRSVCALGAPRGAGAGSATWPGGGMVPGGTNPLGPVPGATTPGGLQIA